MKPERFFTRRRPRQNDSVGILGIKNATGKKFKNILGNSTKNATDHSFRAVLHHKKMPVVAMVYRSAR